MKHNHAFSDSDINFLSQKIKKLSDSIEDKKLKEQLDKAIETLSEVKKRFSATSLEKRLRRKYKWFSLDSENPISLEDIDIPIDIQSADYDPEELFILWSEVWPLSRYLLDMMALDSTFDTVMDMRAEGDIGLYSIVNDYASQLYDKHDLEEIEDILFEFIEEVMEYANITVHYDDRSYSFYSSSTRRYYSWRSWRLKLASFWMGLSSLFPFAPAFAQQLKQQPDPLDKAIVQRGKLIKRRSALAPSVVSNVEKYARHVVSINEQLRKAALYGGQQEGDPIFYIEKHGMRHQEDVNLLVSQIDTIVASKEIKNILVNPAFVVYLRNKLNEFGGSSRFELIQQKDSLLSSIVHGEQDGYSSYLDNLYSYAQEGRIKIISTPEHIDIRVYDSPNGSILYSIRLTTDGFAARPYVEPLLSYGLDANKVIASNVVYTIPKNIMRRAPQDFKYLRNIAKENPQSIGVAIQYRKNQNEVHSIIYVLFKADFVIGNP